MAEDGDDVTAEVLVVRTQSNTPCSGATANTTSTADILKVLERKNEIILSIVPFVKHNFAYLFKPILLIPQI